MFPTKGWVKFHRLTLQGRDISEWSRLWPWLKARIVAARIPRSSQNWRPDFPPGWRKQDFLTSTEQVTSWIGLFKEDQGGAHRWTDGSALTYINWNSKDLNGNGAAPACVMMLQQGHWSDSSCDSESLVYICEKRQSC
ncbi:low affinity immunoglobulin epsilon Fc receptor [Carlito syrichta]|uniref:low affinity immunoglobulin epsilon Fc receptor n=1 Tax=Carlito syrichta TaxID=1868482 RepID=UPI000B536156|nr:low affinity immunoglobulin epsilon Fc receptor [Carlito syrichta]